MVLHRIWNGKIKSYCIYRSLVDFINLYKDHDISQSQNLSPIPILAYSPETKLGDRIEWSITLCILKRYAESTSDLQIL